MKNFDKRIKEIKFSIFNRTKSKVIISLLSFLELFTWLYKKSMKSRRTFMKKKEAN